MRHPCTPARAARTFLQRLVAVACLLGALAAPALAAEGRPDPGSPARPLPLDDSLIGMLMTTTTSAADTLLDVAYRHDLGFIELAAANPEVDPWLPGEGTQVLLPTQHLLPNAPREGVVINLAEMRLYHFDRQGGVHTYPVGIGRRGLKTPTGTTRVTAKVRNPTWYPTKRMREEDPSLPHAVPAGPDNPLGAFAIDLGWPSYLIHGTNNRWGIGRRVSSGCIRLYPSHIEALFNSVDSGTAVTVVDQPLKYAWIDGTLYVEAHTTQDQAEQLEETGRFAPDPDVNLPGLVAEAASAEAAAPDARIDWTRLQDVVRARRGIPMPVSRPARSPGAS